MASPKSFPKNATTSNPSVLTQRLTEAHTQITQLLSICGAPGIAYGIIHHGVLLSTDACGYRDVESRLSPNKDTKFLIGSISKTFLSAAVGLAVRDGRINLDAPLSKYLPTFNPKSGSDPRVRDATIRQVLSHTSGLGNPQILINGPRDSALQGEADFVTFTNQIPTSNKKGDRFGRWTYSNLGYGLVGLVLQNVYGCRYADLVQEQLLTPLGLHRTALNKADACDMPGVSLQKEGGYYGREAVDVASIRSENQDQSPGQAQGQHQGQHPGHGNSRNPDQNVAFPYARLQDGTHCRLMCDNTTDEHRTTFLAPMGMRSSVSDLVSWGAAIISPQPPPALSTITTLIEDRHSWKEGRRQWHYHMGWARTHFPTDWLGILSFNCCSGNRPVLDFQEKATPVLQTNGTMNGSTAVIYTFPSTQTVIVACANAASDGDAADWTAKILAQSLLAPNDQKVDFLKLAELEAQARRSMYERMIREWEDGRQSEFPGEVCLLDYVGVYEGLGTTLEISVVCTARTSAAEPVPHGGLLGERDMSKDTRQQPEKVELQLVFNGVLESAQSLEWYRDDVLSFFPQTRDKWLGESMFNWDFVDTGLLKFKRDCEGDSQSRHDTPADADTVATSDLADIDDRDAIENGSRGGRFEERKIDEVSALPTTSNSRRSPVVSLTWGWDEAENPGTFTKR
ncbi:hypothetical protein ONS95_009125 [Cadophora gregata]|uniref:uncharacterized protein n=1 Tax=Cadophora gregata TaxID=51156 RepID=UPI0026DB748D|nr:uncharacterized protein ONS95_009125 [Cadophora gregata]KAK0124142.1 hypothetical protein ONS95_009125 [Cadophora gregata]